MQKTFNVSGNAYTVQVDQSVSEVNQNSISTDKQPMLYCSSGDFPLYDSFLYSQMTADRPRTEIYELEIQAQVRGKTVVDIGTGAHANWAILAAESGATKVYAIETIESSYKAALQVINNSAHADRIVLFHGLSTDVILPERVDICVSEILGCPISSEGVAAVLADARKRFLKDSGSFIIDACTSRIAACRLSDEFRGRLGVHESDISYLNSVFSAVGRPFDIRMVIDNFPKDWIVSTEGNAEAFHFNADFSPNQTSEGCLTITQDTRVDGIAGWINIKGGPNSPTLDTLRTRTTWLPIFHPVFYPGIQLKKGDEIRYTAATYTSTDPINPDYSIIGTIERKGEVLECFEFYSPFISNQYRDSDFYKAIFPG